MRRSGPMPARSRTVLGGAGDFHAVGGRAEVEQAVAVAFGLHAEPADARKQVAREGAELAVALVGVGGDAAVDHDGRDAALSGEADPVGPDFVFDEHDGGRPDAVERARHDAGDVHGEVERDVGRGEPLEGEGVSGGGVAGEDEADGGIEAAEFVHEGERDGEFADADGLDPDGAAGGVEEGGDVAAVAREALEEAAPVAAAPHHAKEEVREEAGVGDGKNEIVEPPDHGRGA